MAQRVLSLAALLAGAVWAPHAGAADLPRRYAPPVEAFQLQPTWSGFYLGGHVGGIVNGQGDQTVVSGDGGPVAAPPFGGRGGRTGVAFGEVRERAFLAGVHAGYNVQQGRLVFGVEGDVDLLGRVDDVLASVRGRVGFGGDQVLVYGTAGVAFLSLNGDATGVFVGGNGGAGGNGGPGGQGGTGGNGFGTRVVGGGDLDRTGFVGGVGAEVKVSARVGVGAEALYYTFDRSRFDIGAGDLPRDFVTVRGRLSFYLDASDAPARGFGPASVVGPAWSGFYGGAHFGALSSTSNSSIDRVDLANGEAGTAGVRGIDGGGGGGGAVAFAGLQRSAAFTGGGHLGYNVQQGRLVLGGEVDASASSNDSNRVFGSVRGRVGFVHQGFLFYGTGGLAVVRDESVRAIFAENGGAGGNGGTALAGPGGAGGFGGRALAFSTDETRIGFVVGAGLEAKLTDRIAAGVEGLYYSFEDRRALPALPANGRAFVAGNDASDALVLRTRLSIALQP